MFLVQLAVCAAFWAATVALLARRREALLARFARAAPGRRLGLAVGALSASVALLALGTGALAMGGLTPRGLSWWGLPTIAVVGAAFVVLQTLALVPLVLNAVTRDGRRTSDKADADRP